MMNVTSRSSADTLHSLQDLIRNSALSLLGPDAVPWPGNNRREYCHHIIARFIRARVQLLPVTIIRLEVLPARAISTTKTHLCRSRRRVEWTTSVGCRLRLRKGKAEPRRRCLVTAAVKTPRAAWTATASAKGTINGDLHGDGQIVVVVLLQEGTARMTYSCTMARPLYNQEPTRARLYPRDLPPLPRIRL